jgi:SAM-dependent methyltransferase
MSELKANQCPACEHQENRIFCELNQMPVSIGVQWATKDEAEGCKKGNISLAFCEACGFIWNTSFDASQLEYSKRYDNSLDYSPVFERYARDLARRLIETYQIRNKHVVELGSGKGHFLALLCELGNNAGTGFDPSFEGERIKSPAANRITYINDFYGEKYTQHRGNLVCSRHVFEHIPDPVDFLSMVRRTIGEQKETVVYFEVPNVRLILERLSVWDVIYEHCSYFSHESLGNVFRRCGFHLLDLRDGYDGQFLSIEATLDSSSGSRNQNLSDLKALKGLVARFSAEMSAKYTAWHEKLEEIRGSGKKAVIWGAGAKTVSFVNMLQIKDLIPYAVDINPHKQGMYLAGTGQKIIAPEFVREFRPDLVVVMNPIYRNEIQKSLDELGVKAEMIVE